MNDIVFGGLIFLIIVLMISNIPEMIFIWAMCRKRSLEEIKELFGEDVANQFSGDE